jgi:hypothetical protein
MSSPPDGLSRPTHRPGWLPDTQSTPVPGHPPLERAPLQPDPFHALGEQPLDQLPDDVLRQFTTGGTRSWSGEPVSLPGAVTCGLWIDLIANIPLAAWLKAVRSGTAPCSGLPCTIATLGDHPGLLLMLSGCCVATLAGCAVMTRGLSRAGAVPLALALVGALGGAIALSGVLGLLIISAVCLGILLTTLAIFVDRV